MAARRNARTRQPSRAAYHAKWIAINIALLLFSAWLYGTQLIPRYILHSKPPLGQQEGDVTPTQVREFFTPASNSTSTEPPPLRGERPRPAASRSGPLGSPWLIEVTNTTKNGHAKCIGGRVYFVTVTATGTTIEQSIATCYGWPTN